MRDHREGRPPRQLAAEGQRQRAVEPDLEVARGSQPQLVPGRTTLTQALAFESSSIEAADTFDGQLATARRLLAVLGAANGAADPHASCRAASQLRSALRAIEVAIARARGERAEVMAARASALRDACRPAIEVAFTPSRAAIREAVDGSGRRHWDREVAAWRAARGHAEPAPAEPLAISSAGDEIEDHAQAESPLELAARGT